MHEKRQSLLAREDLYMRTSNGSFDICCYAYSQLTSLSPITVSISSLPLEKEICLCLCTPKTSSPTLDVLADKNEVKSYYDLHMQLLIP